MFLHPHAIFYADIGPDEDPWETRGFGIAGYLQKSLTKAGVTVSRLENWRDCGWKIYCEVNKRRVYFYVAEYDEPNKWMLCCSSSLGVFGRILGKPSDDKEKIILAAAVHKALEGDDRFRDIRWWPVFQGEDYPSVSRPELFDIG